MPPRRDSTEEEEGLIAMMWSQPWYVKVLLVIMFGVCFTIIKNETAGATDLPHALLWAACIGGCIWIHIELNNHREYYEKAYVPPAPWPFNRLRGFQLFFATLFVPLVTTWFENQCLTWISIPTVEERASFGKNITVSPLKQVHDYPHVWVKTAYASGGWMHAFLDLPGLSAEHCFALMVSLVFVYSRVDRTKGLRMFANGALALSYTRMLRTASFMSTRMPTPNAQCIQDRFSDAPLPSAHWTETAAYVIFKISPGGGCHDLVFSGHTTSYVLGVALFYLFCRNRKIHWFILFGTFHTALGTIRHLFHYTVDITISIYTTAMVIALVYRVQANWKDIEENDDEMNEKAAKKHRYNTRSKKVA